MLSILDLSFLSDAWRQLIYRAEGDTVLVVRKHFEVAIFSYLAQELHAGDVFIEDAESFSNYREELIDDANSESLILSYCQQLGLPNNAKAFVRHLREDLTTLSRQVDQAYPELSELVIDEFGNPTLKKRKKGAPHSTWLAQEIRQRLPERNILDILCSSHHYTGWAHEFGPISGSDPKIDNPIERYILTNFSYGSCMGPTQAARHIKADITAHMLSWINRRHVTVANLNKALTRLINFCNTLPIIVAWGDGNACAADGTLRRIREENLIAEFHLRYGSRGGIAYHHIANNYIALFSTFIPCGVWEAVEIIEALLKNQSDLQPITVHADTQGQSTVVFALSYLLGIQLMPRIRNWKHLKLFRPTPHIKYKHIDALFSDSINWKLIESTWKEIMRVVISIKEGKITSSRLLRKLTHYSKKDPLYRGFQELGRVIRTQFLLKYIADVELRETITAETNKVESYNNLSEWASFGSIVLVASNDEDEMEKAIKYNGILTNSIILQNIVDISEIIYQLQQEGKIITKADISYLSPYIVEHIKRFGEYFIDLGIIPRHIRNALSIVL